MDVIRGLLAAGLLLLLGDFVATFGYHVPEHVFGRLHTLIHHSPNRSFIRYAIRTRQPLVLVGGFLSAFPYFLFAPLLWFMSPWGLGLGLGLATAHGVWRHRFPPQHQTPLWLQRGCCWLGITTPERHWIHHRYPNRAFGDIFSFYDKPAVAWLKWLRRLKQQRRSRSLKAR